MARISGCLTKLLLWTVVGLASVWGLLVALHPWALHIGGRSTPLLYWHGTGTALAKGGKTFPLYMLFFPGRPQGVSGGGRREGKIVSARLQGTGWLCIAPGTVERMDVIGTMFGGYMSDTNSLLEFRLLEWRRPFAINPPKRGFFDLAGTWNGAELVMNRPNEQGIPFNSGLFIDHAVVTLRWASFGEFEAACRAMRQGPGHYSLFAVPQSDAWTVIVNKTPRENIGRMSFYPGEASDMVRVPVTTSKLASTEENFTISFVRNGSTCEMRFDWEQTRASVTVEEGKP